MKKIYILSAVLMFLSVTSSNSVSAETIGYADFKKIEKNYAFAQKAYKEIDDKVLGLQQYLIDKDKEYKTIESPLSRKNFEQKVEKEYKAKEDALLKLKTQKEEEVFNNIQAASKIVSSKLNIDVVFDYRVILSGGTDITQNIIDYLNSNPKELKNK